MRILRGFADLLSSTFGRNPRPSAEDDGSDSDYYASLSDADIAAAQALRREREDSTTFNLADVRRIPEENRVMDASHAWQQELIPGYGAQSDLYLIRILKDETAKARERLLDALYYDDIPELDEDSVETIFHMELRDPENQPFQAVSG